MTDPDTTQAALLAGRYRLNEMLGRGGMGTVWCAVDETLGRRVAIKELRVPRHVDDDERDTLSARMLREARAAARIDHPNVVTIFDVVEEDGRPWIVMEYVRGQSLAHVLDKDGAIPPGQVAEMGLRLVAALEAAHDAGVLHRDVKPANVLLAHSGRVVLTDFGVASVEDSATLTQAGALLGSPEYLAPEQVAGEAPGPEADLWSLGVTLYEAAEGRPAYRRNSHAATLAAVAAAKPPRMDRAGPLTPVLRGLLVKNPQARAPVARARELLTATADRASVPTGPGADDLPGRHHNPVRRHAVHAGVSPPGDGQSPPRHHVREPHQERAGAPGDHPLGSTDTTLTNARVAPQDEASSTVPSGSFRARFRHWPRWWLRNWATLLGLLAIGSGAGARWLAAYRTWTGWYTIILLALALLVWLVLPHRRISRSVPVAMLLGVIGGGALQWAEVNPDPLVVAVVLGVVVVLGPILDRWVLRRVRRRPALGFALPVPDGWICRDSDNGLSVSDPDRLISVTVTVDRGIVMPPQESVVHREHDSVAGRDRFKSEDYRRLRLGPVEHRGHDAAEWEYVWNGPDGVGYHGRDLVVRTGEGVRYWMTVRSREDLWGTAGRYFRHACDHLSIAS